MGRVVIATTTWYRSPDEVRAKEAFKTVRSATSSSLPIVVVDGSPSMEVKARLIDLRAVLLAEEKGTMGLSRRQAIREAVRLAGEDGVVVWMEPEKNPLVSFIHQMVQPILDGQYEIVVPRRRDCLASYPEFQMHAELYGNDGFRLLTGKALDVWFGPRAFSTEAAKYFLAYDGKSLDGSKYYGDRWDSIFIPLVRAITEGQRVGEVVVDYIHPQEQTAAEEGFTDYKKRMLQLTSLIEAVECEVQLLRERVTS
ncbi:MAG: hypothetical protein AAB584_00475 [Patescibacteria group bacterium]